MSDPNELSDGAAPRPPVATTPRSNQVGTAPIQGAQPPPLPRGQQPDGQGPAEDPPRRLFIAEIVEERLSAVDGHSWPFRVWLAGWSLVEWVFGLICLVAGLGIAAAVPLLQFVSLGYLLEVSGRISRSGRIRDGFYMISTAARIGSILMGTWLMLLPLRLAADLRYSAELLAEGTWISFAWRLGAFTGTCVMTAHILLAWYCGGRLRHFFWPLLAPVFFFMWLVRHVISLAAASAQVRPLLERISPRLLNDLTKVPPLEEWFPPAILWRGIRRGVVYSEAREAVWLFMTGLRLPYFFWLGLRGFVGSVVWLGIPVLMIIGTTKLSLNDREAAQGIGLILSLLGSGLLAVVVLYLPFLQAHFAAETRFAALFELGQARRMFRRAPIAFWFSLLVTLLFAIPLYLLKVELIPREVAGLPSLVFVVFIFPARLITGWAMGRARKRDLPRHFIGRWLSRLAGIPVAMTYVLIVYLTQYISWYGAWSLFEQHAFLLPVPFVSM